MEDYNPFAGASAVDFNEVDRKAKEAAAQDQPQSAQAPAAAKSPAEADYSPFASQSNPFSASAASPASVTTPGGAQFGLASPPAQAAPPLPAYSPPPAYGAPSAPSMAPMGGPVGLDGQPLPGASAPAYGAPAASPYGAPPPYGGAPQYGAPQGTWPPPSAAPGTYMPMQNDSGMKAGVPPEIAAFKWNWGAFFLDFWWAIANKVQPYGWILLGIALISWIPVVGSIAALGALIVRIYLSIEGHKLAWKNRRFEGGVGEFIQVQSAWMKWGIGLAIIPFFLGIFAAILFPVFAKARQKAMQNGGYSSGQSGPGFGGDSSDGGASSSSDSAPPPSAPSSGGGADAGSAGAYGIGGDSGSDGASGPSVGFHPKD